jgi:hypothetical protein
VPYLLITYKNLVFVKFNLMGSSNLIKLLTCFTAFVHNALFQAKLSLYNYGDIIGGCDITVCTSTPGTPRGAAYESNLQIVYDSRVSSKEHDKRASL